MIKANLDAPLSVLAKVIEEKDRSEFRRAFDALTAGCNACHTAAADAFIRASDKAAGQQSRLRAQRQIGSATP